MHARVYCNKGETNPKQISISIVETMNDNVNQLSYWFLIAFQIYSESQPATFMQ